MRKSPNPYTNPYDWPNIRVIALLTQTGPKSFECEEIVPTYDGFKVLLQTLSAHSISSYGLREFIKGAIIAAMSRVGYTSELAAVDHHLSSGTCLRAAMTYAMRDKWNLKWPTISQAIFLIGATTSFTDIDIIFPPNNAVLKAYLPDLRRLACLYLWHRRSL